MTVRVQPTPKTKMILTPPCCRGEGAAMLKELTGLSRQFYFILFLFDLIVLVPLSGSRRTLFVTNQVTGCSRP